MTALLNPTVLNVRDVGMRNTATRIYVGRPSKWSNPYKINEDGDRTEVLEYFRRYLLQILSRQPEFLDELRGKDLVCWCAPLPCHADLLLSLANLEEPERQAFFGELDRDVV
jgi:hypothetical protein